MSVSIVVPPMGESVTEATVAKWLKNVGDSIAVDEPLVELETDKVTLEVNASSAGTLAEILAAPGSTVKIGATLGTIGAAGAAAKPAASAAPAVSAVASANVNAPAAAMPMAANAPAPMMLPAARKLADEQNLNPYNIPGTGKGGRITKEDVMNVAGPPAAAPANVVPMSAPVPMAMPTIPTPSAPRAPSGKPEERVKMTRLRQRIAQRLKEAQNTAAMLTTFNEVDMTNVMALRTSLKDSFEKKHGTKLGFMSFFVKACIVALREIPAVNAEISGDEIIYKNYYDIGVAVGTPQGLVVPVLRNADVLSFADIEKGIAQLGAKARDGKLSMEELTGGTFTITNGGIYGSLMSTPILNPPQSGILGMHAIKERAVVVNGKIEARPMMYIALSYDHRIIDGREAVTFLYRIKECMEDPQRILLDV